MNSKQTKKKGNKTIIKIKTVVSLKKNGKAKFGRLSKLNHEFGNSGKAQFKPKNRKPSKHFKDVDGAVIRADMIKRAMEGGGEDFR